jgi:hypothetical protein
MKTSIALAALLLAFSLPSCHETKEEIANPVAESEYYKTIGEQIPYETGMKWIAYYRKQNNKQGRTESTGYHVPATQLNALLGSVKDLTGVALHYGLDGMGQKHILLIPVNSSLRLWPSDSQQVIIDANTGREIDRSLAYEWSEHYKSAYPTGIWFHFFGKNIFDEIKSLPYLNSIDIEPAINLLNLTPQLLLLVWNDEAILGGRTSNSEAMVYDASNACPPCAVR